MFDRVEKWFGAPEVNAAGRMGLYRILYGLWLIWLLASIDFGGLGARPAPPAEPIGVMKILSLTPMMHYAHQLAYGIGFLLGFAAITLTAGLATRFSTILLTIGGVLLFTWDSSFGKVVDKYVLLGCIVPFWMIFSRWGDVYSVDALINKFRGRPVPDVSESDWEYIWPQRAVIVFIAVLYFTAGYTKVFEGTWLSNPNVVLEKLNSNLLHDWVFDPVRLNPILYWATRTMPLLFVVGQYGALAMELGYPLALLNGRLRTLFFAAAALFHAMTILILGIGFAPMIMVLAINVDWQNLYEKVWPFSRLAKVKAPVATRPGLILLSIGIVGLALISGVFTAWPPNGRNWLAFLPDQKLVWLGVAPFALVALGQTILTMIREVRARLKLTPA